MTTRKIIDIPTKKLAKMITATWKRFGCKNTKEVKQPNGKWTALASGCPG